MRIGFISTYLPIECGIATYTKYLTDALRSREMDIYVVYHLGGSGENVFTAFDYMAWRIVTTGLIPRHFHRFRILPILFSSFSSIEIFQLYLISCIFFESGSYS